MNHIDTTTSPGIYKITCIGNGIIYIGSACNLRRRKREHFSKFQRGANDNKRMQYSCNKYGIDQMVYSIVEIVDNLDILLEREQYYIDLFQVCNSKIGFNNAPIAGNCVGVRHSDETRRKISEVQRGRKLSKEHKLKISLTTKGREGKPTSEETKQKQRDIKLKNPTKYWLGKNHSEETRKKISQVQIGKKASEDTKAKMRKTALENKLKGVKAYKAKTVTVLDPTGNLITITNIAEFCRNKTLSPSCLGRVISGERDQHKGYRKAPSI